MTILKAVGIGLLAIFTLKIAFVVLGLAHTIVFTLFWGVVLYFIIKLILKLTDKSK